MLCQPLNYVERFFTIDESSNPINRHINEGQVASGKEIFRYANGPNTGSRKICSSGLEICSTAAQKKWILTIKPALVI